MHMNFEFASAPEDIRHGYVETKRHSAWYAGQYERMKFRRVLDHVFNSNSGYGHEDDGRAEGGRNH